jgi:mannonate dehydratase
LAKKKDKSISVSTEEANKAQIAPALLPAQGDPWKAYAAPGKEPVRIRDVKVILTCPDNIRLVIVKVETSEPGLYGIGCATFTQRPLAVVTAIEEYLKPFVIGRDVHDIEDAWQAAFVSSYWRSGPVLNNALSGIDMALWDIKGKLAGMPVYQLLGGKTRSAAAVYVHASGMDFEEVAADVERYRDLGFKYIRAQVAVPGSATYGVGKHQSTKADRNEGHLQPKQDAWDPAAYTRIVPKLFDHLRGKFGYEIELLHDIHERVAPMQAINLARDLDQFKLFFLEDPFAPEDNGYFPLLRQHSTTPIAMGELYVNTHEYVPLIQERLIDFIRIHISDIGGLTRAWKLAAMAEFYAVRTAWHGPGDASPVAHAANLQLDLACSNFGIQEAYLFPERTKEVFPGSPEVYDGAMWSNEQPGLGIDIDEKEAAKYPYPSATFNGAWPAIRQPDGTVVKP